MDTFDGLLMLFGLLVLARVGYEGLNPSEISRKKVALVTSSRVCD